MNELWNARRVKLQDTAKTAILDLFEHTSAASMKLPVDASLTLVISTEQTAADPMPAQGGETP